MKQTPKIINGALNLAYRMGYIDRDEEIVRCKDCEYYYEKEWVVGGGSFLGCWYQSIGNAKPHDFCSRGKRRKDNG